ELPPHPARIESIVAEQNSRIHPLVTTPISLRRDRDHAPFTNLDIWFRPNLFPQLWSTRPKSGSRPMSRKQDRPPWNERPIRDFPSWDPPEFPSESVVCIRFVIRLDPPAHRGLAGIHKRELCETYPPTSLPHN